MGLHVACLGAPPGPARSPVLLRELQPSAWVAPGQGCLVAS